MPKDMRGWKGGEFSLPRVRKIEGKPVVRIVRPSSRLEVWAGRTGQVLSSFSWTMETYWLLVRGVELSSTKWERCLGRGQHGRSRFMEHWCYHARRIAHKGLWARYSYKAAQAISVLRNAVRVEVRSPGRWATLMRNVVPKALAVR